MDDHNFLINVSNDLWIYHILEGTLSCYNPFLERTPTFTNTTIWKFAANNYGTFWLNGPGDNVVKGFRSLDTTTIIAENFMSSLGSGRVFDMKIKGRNLYFISVPNSAASVAFKVCQISVDNL